MAVIEDDKKYHELRKADKKDVSTLCGKTAIRMVRLGTGGIDSTIDEICEECFKKIMEKNK